MDMDNNKEEKITPTITKAKNDEKRVEEEEEENKMMTACPTTSASTTDTTTPSTTVTQTPSNERSSLRPLLLDDEENNRQNNNNSSNNNCDSSNNNNNYTNNCGDGDDGASDVVAEEENRRRDENSSKSSTDEQQQLIDDVVTKKELEQQQQSAAFPSVAVESLLLFPPSVVDDDSIVVIEETKQTTANEENDSSACDHESSSTSSSIDYVEVVGDRTDDRTKGNDNNFASSPPIVATSSTSVQQQTQQEPNAVERDLIDIADVPSSSLVTNDDQRTSGNQKHLDTTTIINPSLKLLEQKIGSADRVGTTSTVVTITTATSPPIQHDESSVILSTPLYSNNNNNNNNTEAVVNNDTLLIDEFSVIPSAVVAAPPLPQQFVGNSSNVVAGPSVANYHNPFLLPPSSSNKISSNVIGGGDSTTISANQIPFVVHHTATSTGGNNSMYPQTLYYGHPVHARGPRHGSGNGNLGPGLTGRGGGGVRGGGSHLGFAGGGSERELCSDLLMNNNKENVKRWSLAGTNPELALLRVKLEDVQRELSDLRSKHEAKLNDYQSVLHQLEFCQETKNQLETELKSSRTEIIRLKTDYDRLLQQKQLLDRQVIDLQLKLQRKQGELDEILVGRGPNSAGGDLTRKLMEEYEDIRMEREKLKEKCREFDVECNDLRQTLLMAQEECRTMQIQYESELEAQKIKIESMEHRQMAVYQQLHKMAQDRDLLRTDREVLRQQWEESCANATRFQNILQKREEDLHILQRKNDGVLAEYHRVMSERDSVLKENERLSEEKSNLIKKLKSSESDRQATLEQLRTREIQIQNLQRERDEYLRGNAGGVVKSPVDDVVVVVNSSSLLIDQQQRHKMTIGSPGAGGNVVGQSPSSSNGNNGVGGPQNEIIGSPETYSEQRSIASSEDEVAMITSRAQEEKLDEMRRRIDALKDQFESSRQEVDSAKQQRDWALGERQRIVAERDSMRTMCDTLRRERDDAITKLAVAIRDTDELQRQKEHAERELKKLKDRLELNNIKPKIAPTNHDPSPSHSRDSAIDTDLAEWEIETLELNMSGNQKNEDLGLELRGGRDDPIYGTTVPVYVESLCKGSKLDGNLKVFDCIMQVNNIDVANMDRRAVMDILKNSNSVKMVIKRRRLIGMKLISVPLDSNGDDDVGVFFEDGVYVTKIKTSSMAAKAGNLAVGDRLIYVNDIPVHGKTASEVDDLVQSHKGCGLVLAVMKSPPVLSPMTPSASLPGNFLNNNNNNNTNNNGTNNNRTKPSSNGVALTSFNNNNNNTNNHVAQVTKQQTVAALRDESAQTSSSASDVATTASSGYSPPKKESLLDKVHDKFFGKSEKKATVRASASIPNEVVVTFPKSSTSTGGATANRWRVHPHTGSERSSAANRFRASSVCSSISADDNRTTTSTTLGDEQQILKQLDSILEASEKECAANKGVTKVLHAEKGGSGGTWPKYRPSPLMIPSGGGNVAAPVVGHPLHRPNERKSVLPVMVGQQQQQSNDLNDSGRNINLQNSINGGGGGLNCLRPNSSQQMKIRGSDSSRPMSYHPATVSTPKYVPYNEISTLPAAPSSPPQHYYDERLFSIAPVSRPSSVQSSRKQQYRVSSYDPPSSAYSSGRIGVGGEPMVVYKQPHLIARAVPVHSVHPRYSPAPPGIMSQLSSSGAAGNSFGEELDVGGVVDDGQSSIASQTSSDGLSRTSGGLNKHHYYLHHHQPNNTNNSHMLPKYPQNKTGSVSPFTDELNYPQTRLSQGDVRLVRIEKRGSYEGLGIRIAPSNGQGVFVSCVSEHSLAAKHGLQVGDQLLEFCGVNLRQATTALATNVLSTLPGIEETITLRVQYNPERYYKEVAGGGDGRYTTTSVASTPRATPNSMTGSGLTAKSFLSRESSIQSTNTQHSRELLTSADGSLRSEPRFVFLKKEGSDWGFTLIGGNAIGIFVDDLKPDSAASCPDGLRDGDQILEFDGINFRKLTLEQALATLERPCDSTVSILAQYNETSKTKYQKCKAGAGDSFYVRVLVDRQAENIDELSYKAGDILRVDNTVFNGVTGLWRAWLVDQEGRERSCGIIPSKTKLEEEFLFKRSGSEISAGGGDGSSEGGGSRRGTIRRSLKFIRRSSRTNATSTSSTANAPPPPQPPHQRTPSKESRDMQDTDTIIADELYQRVERFPRREKRPVLILGALMDVFVAKLLEDYPHMFSHCVPECVQPESIKRLEQNLQHNIYVDYRKRDKCFEITSVAAVKEIIDKGFHCILHVSLAAIERLHRLQIYPVVIFVKFKSSKQIKEISDDRISSKQAKELLEAANRLEGEHHNLFSCLIQGTHNNVKYICQQIACAVEHEQKKTLWIVSNETL